MGKLFGGFSTRLVSLQALAVLVAVAVTGCAGPSGHQLAFSEKTALIGNSRQLDLSASQALRVTKQVLVRQGFTIENVDANAGLIKATRNFQDPKMSEQSYNISASAYVFENADSTTLTLSASQQTILHREWTTWWHLLWILPIIPTGTEYQTVVTK